MPAAIGKEFDHFDLGGIVGHLGRHDRHIVATNHEFGSGGQRCGQQGQGNGEQPSSQTFMHWSLPFLVFANHVGLDALSGEIGTQVSDVVHLVVGPDPNAIPDLVLQHHLLNSCLCAE
jgi:hypothetical protein